VLSISVFLASIDAQEWEDCVDSHRDDEEQSFVDTCYSHTQALKECMDRNPEYYQTINVRYLNLHIISYVFYVPRIRRSVPSQEEDSDEDPAQAKGDRVGKNANASQHAERSEEGERQKGDA